MTWYSSNYISLDSSRSLVLTGFSFGSISTWWRKLRLKYYTLRRIYILHPVTSNQATMAWIYSLALSWSYLSYMSSDSYRSLVSNSSNFSLIRALWWKLWLKGCTLRRNSKLWPACNQVIAAQICSLILSWYFSSYILFDLYRSLVTNNNFGSIRAMWKKLQSKFSTLRRSFKLQPSASTKVYRL